jgi:hypothetical protein
LNLAFLQRKCLYKGEHPARKKKCRERELREHRDWCFDQRKQHERAAAGLLDDLDASVLQILRGVRELVLNDVLTDTEKVAKIGALVEPEQIAETKSRALRAALSRRFGLVVPLAVR